jgi:hypothetical protein
MLAENRIESQSESHITLRRAPTSRIVAHITVSAEPPHWTYDLFIGFALKSQAARFCKLAYRRGYAPFPAFSEPTFLKGKGFRWEAKLLGTPKSTMDRLIALDKKDILAEQAMTEFLQESVSKGLVSKSEVTKLLHSMRSNGALFR